MLKKVIGLVIPLLLCFPVISHAETVSLVESDGSVALFYGGSYGDSVRFTSFAFDAGYRFFPSISPKLSLDAYVGLLAATANESLFVAYLMPRYFFSEENRGLNLGLGLGYATRASSKGFALGPTAGYDFRILDKLTVGPEASAHIVLGSPSSQVYALLAALRYWF